MAYLSKLTTKSQITVPKDVRIALGVGPGQQVRFSIDSDGRVALVAADNAEERDRRKAKFLNRVAKASAEFRKHDPLPGIDGLAYQQMMRGDGPEV